MKRHPLLSDLSLPRLRRLHRSAEAAFGAAASTTRAYRRALAIAEARESRAARRGRKAVRDAR
jgi:hypothetical protein